MTTDREVAEKIASNPNGYTPDSVQVAQAYLSDNEAMQKVVDAAIEFTEQKAGGYDKLLNTLDEYKSNKGV